MRTTSLPSLPSLPVAQDPSNAPVSPSHPIAAQIGIALARAFIAERALTSELRHKSYLPNQVIAAYLADSESHTATHRAFILSAITHTKSLKDRSEQHHLQLRAALRFAIAHTRHVNGFTNTPTRHNGDVRAAAGTLRRFANALLVREIFGCHDKAELLRLIELEDDDPGAIKNTANGIRHSVNYSSAIRRLTDQIRTMARHEAEALSDSDHLRALTRAVDHLRSNNMEQRLNDVLHGTARRGETIPETDDQFVPIKKTRRLRPPRILPNDLLTRPELTSTAFGDLYAPALVRAGFSLLLPTRQSHATPETLSKIDTTARAALKALASQFVVAPSPSSHTPTFPPSYLPDTDTLRHHVHRQIIDRFCSETYLRHRYAPYASTPFAQGFDASLTLPQMMMSAREALPHPPIDVLYPERSHSTVTTLGFPPDGYQVAPPFLTKLIDNVCKVISGFLRKQASEAPLDSESTKRLLVRLLKECEDVPPPDAPEEHINAAAHTPPLFFIAIAQELTMQVRAMQNRDNQTYAGTDTVYPDDIYAANNFEMAEPPETNRYHRVPVLDVPHWIGHNPSPAAHLTVARRLFSLALTPPQDSASEYYSTFGLISFIGGTNIFRVNPSLLDGT